MVIFNSSVGFPALVEHAHFFAVVEGLTGLAGCGEENAAKVAPWIGMSTIVESKADSFAKFAVDKLGQYKP